METITLMFEELTPIDIVPMNQIPMSIAMQQQKDTKDYGELYANYQLTINCIPNPEHKTVLENATTEEFANFAQEWTTTLE